MFSGTCAPAQMLLCPSVLGSKTCICNCTTLNLVCGCWSVAVCLGDVLLHVDPLDVVQFTSLKLQLFLLRLQIFSNWLINQHLRQDRFTKWWQEVCDLYKRPTLYIVASCQCERFWDVGCFLARGTSQKDCKRINVARKKTWREIHPRNLRWPYLRTESPFPNHPFTGLPVSMVLLSGVKTR